MASSHGLSLPPSALLLRLLCALLLLPCSLAHCPTQCIEVAYLSGNYFKPFTTGALASYTPLQAAAKCAEACASKGTKYFNLTPKNECSCPTTCNPANHNHGVGYFGATFQCFFPPVGFVSTYACTAPSTGTCPFSCNATAINSACNKVGTSQHKCCCTATMPNAVYYNGLKGCAGALNEDGP